MGGPGLRAYAYRAAVYCVDCGRDIAQKVFPAPGLPWMQFCDSEIIPQPIFFPDHDVAQHCDHCNTCLYGGIEK